MVTLLTIIITVLPTVKYIYIYLKQTSTEPPETKQNKYTRREKVKQENQNERKKNIKKVLSRPRKL